MEYALLLIFLGAVVAAAIMDLLTMTIPNKICAAIFAAFLIFAAVNQMPLAEFAMHLGAGALVLAVTFFLFTREWIGGGDAKFASAIACWMGFSHLVDFLLLTAILGGPVTIIFLLFKNIPLPPFFMSKEWIARLHDKKSGVPYGLALAPAALWTFMYLPFVQSIVTFWQPVTSAG